MKRLLVVMAFLSLLAGSAAVVADDDASKGKDPETVIKSNCQQEAEDAGITPDELEDYIRQCVAQQKYWQDDGEAFGDSGDDGQGNDQQDDGSGDGSSEDDNESDSWDPS